MDRSTYISTEQLATNNETTVTAMVGEYYLSSKVPACCKHNCKTEPDGICEHGNPSLLVAMGVV